MRVFGVASFLIGVAALAFLAIRRGQQLPLKAADYLAMFLGIAGAIMGIAVFFMRFK